jgi:hypothetical protein
MCIKDVDLIKGRNIKNSWKRISCVGKGSCLLQKERRRDAKDESLSIKIRGEGEESGEVLL